MLFTALRADCLGLHDDKITQMDTTIVVTISQNIQHLCYIYNRMEFLYTFSVSTPISMCTFILRSLWLALAHDFSP